VAGIVVTEAPTITSALDAAGAVSHAEIRNPDDAAAR
jgi:hypothetical protein